jgi:hypothetical protein
MKRCLKSRRSIRSGPPRSCRDLKRLQCENDYDHHRIGRFVAITCSGPVADTTGAPIDHRDKLEHEQRRGGSACDFVAKLQLVAGVEIRGSDVLGPDNQKIGSVTGIL